MHFKGLQIYSYVANCNQLEALRHQLFKREVLNLQYQHLYVTSYPLVLYAQYLDQMSACMEAFVCVLDRLSLVIHTPDLPGVIQAGSSSLPQHRVTQPFSLTIHSHHST